jgi:hypothetical protein
MSVYRINLNWPPKCRTPRKETLQARLERVFDKLYAEAERILQQHKPCQVKLNQHGASCLDCRVRGATVNVMCCGGCKWHTAKGCVANKPLTCRTWLCGSAQNFDGEAFRKLQRIAKRVGRLGFYVGRGDRTDSIENALSYFGVTEYSDKEHPQLAPAGW